MSDATVTFVFNYADRESRCVNVKSRGTFYLRGEVEVR